MGFGRGMGFGGGRGWRMGGFGPYLDYPPMMPYDYPPAFGYPYGPGYGIDYPEPEPPKRGPQGKK